MLAEKPDSSHSSPERDDGESRPLPAGTADDFIPLSGSQPPSPQREATASRNTVSKPSPAADGDPPPLPGGEDPPPLPVGEAPPPLPDEGLPSQPADDGWDALWDDNAQAFYFHNRFTNVTQWENPRVPDGALGPPPGAGVSAKKTGGYDPAIHGDYDPNADYAQAYESDGIGDPSGPSGPGGNAVDQYAATGSFNRFTGKWQRTDLNPENFSDDAKSRRQMGAYFDVDAAANSHDGKSLRAERANKKLSKAELKAFKEKRREKKEEKRRAWLRD